MKNELDILGTGLRLIQDITVGIYKYPNKELGLVVENEEAYFKAVSIGSLFGLHTDLLPKGGKGYTLHAFIPFPDNKTLSQMMEDVFEFQDWCKEHKI